MGRCGVDLGGSAMPKLRRLHPMLALTAALPLLALPGHAAEVRPLTQADFEAPQLLGGTDFDAGVGDVLLRNDRVWAVVSAIGATGDFGIPFTGEVFPTTGVLSDVGTVTGGVPDRNDQLTEVQHILNLDAGSPVLYGALSTSSSGSTASVTVFGNGLFPALDTTLDVATTYSVTDGDAFVAITTTVTNGNAFPVPVFQVADVDIINTRGRLPFTPFPGRGNLFPPLDLSDPLSAFGVYPYLSTPGNNAPSDGPVNNDGSPSDEVTYTYVADSLADPLAGVANSQVVIVGNFFDLAAVGGGAPPLLEPGDSLVYERKLVVARRNDVESTLATALPLLGLGARATFEGTVVDGHGNPVSDAHVFFDNTFPGSDPALEALGVPPGSPVPSTHVLTGPDGRFRAALPALIDPSLAPSVYAARIQAPERDTKEFGPLQVDLGAIVGGPTDLGDVLVSDTGTLAYRVVDAHTGRSIPARLRIFGILGSDNPDFGSQYSSLRNYPNLSTRPGDGLEPITGGNSQVLSETLVGLPALNQAADAHGKGRLQLAPGRYLAIVNRGVEYTAAFRPFSITAGASTKIKVALARVVDTKGFVSMDFHIHSARSFDSSAPIADRVVAYASKGVEVLVASDHDNITDYAPVIHELGLGNQVASIVGNEVTGTVPVPASAVPGGIDAFPQGIGHWNAWPLEVINGARRDGAPADELIPPGAAIDRMRGVDSLKLFGTVPDDASIPEWLGAIQDPRDQEVVMLNHPRAGLAGIIVIGLFNGLGNPSGDPALGGYDPTLPITAFPNNLLLIPSLYNEAVVGEGGTQTTGLSFDALEIFNGPGLGGYLEVREDWFSLLKQGFHKSGTAVADSHRVILENAGFPVSFVASSTDHPGAIDEDELTESVKAMRLVGTTGPFIRFTVKGDRGRRAGLGETVAATGRKVRVKLRVEAAPWIPVEEVRIFANGELIERLPVPRWKVLGRVTRFNRTVPLAGIHADAFLTVEAGVAIDEEGNPLSPHLVKLVQKIEPDIVPLGFTNPIFVDRDGDGYEPPGL